MIMSLTVSDVKDLEKDLTPEFIEGSLLPSTFKVQAFIHNWTNLIKCNVGAMWKASSDDKALGCLGAILLPDINSGELIATGMFWYVHPNYRQTPWALALFFHFEKWAVSVKAARIMMAAPVSGNGKILSKFFQKRGYSPLETHFVKVL